MPGENSGTTKKPTPTIAPNANPSQGMTPQQLADYLMGQRSTSTTVVSGTDFYKTFPAQLSKADKINLQQTMLDLGLYGNTKKNPVAGLWNPDLDGDAFKKVVDLAIANNFFVAGTKTPDYRKVLLIGQEDPKAFSQMFFAPTGGTGYSGPSVTVSTSDVKLNDQKLKATVNAAYLNAVGREATADEIAKAVKAVNAGNQTTTTTTVSKNKKGQTVTNQVTTPGVDAGQMIQDQARSNPEYAPYQMATTYFDAMLNALNSPTGRGA